MWLREKDQLQPCVVESCADGSVLFASDYGEVSEMEDCDFYEPLKLALLDNSPVHLC